MGENSNANKAGIKLNLLAMMACLVVFPTLTRPALCLPSADSLAHKVADRYGLADFPKVQSIHFVFHVLHDGKPMEREWTWFPPSDSVIFKGPDAGGLPIKAAYSRRNNFSLAATNVTAIDKMFMNDQYWLLFPLHLVWDKEKKLTATPTEEGAGKGEAYKLTVLYPPSGGYTPGDAYDLFVDTTGTIKRWIFRRGNSPKPSVEAMWMAPEKKGVLNISPERPGTKPGFKVWFTDLDVLSKG